MHGDLCELQFQVMVLDYKLTYPSGTATAMLINSFHTKSGAELAGYALHVNLTTQKLFISYTLIYVILPLNLSGY